MKTSDVLIVFVRCFFLFVAFLQGTRIPFFVLYKISLPRKVSTIASVFPFMFFLLAAFLQRHIILELPFVRRVVDAKYGQGAHNNFMRRLKPSRLFAACACVLGTTGVIHTYLSTQTDQSYLLSGIFLSSSLGFALAYILSLRFPPTLC